MVSGKRGAGLEGESGVGNFLNAEFLDTKVAEILGGVFQDAIWRDGIARRHLYIDVFKDVPRSDAENALARFDQIITFASAMLPAEVIGETESGSELLGLD